MPRPGSTRGMRWSPTISTPRRCRSLSRRARAVERTLVPHLLAGRVPVLGGFVGSTSSGATTTLGRGGSDYSAALMGAALHGLPAPDGARFGCREIQIWTDVDGMLTADPRVIDDPAVVERLSFAEASELAYFGAKVLHPSTILPAVSARYPGAHPQQQTARWRRHAHHRPVVQRQPGGRRARLQAPRDRRRNHLDPDADGARLPAPAVPGVRAPIARRSTS